MKNTLPIPDSDAKQFTDSLLHDIREEIKKNGPIPFSRYMEMALYTPKLGYYQNTLPKLGDQGDFVTAPEISSLFSKSLASQCADILEDISDGDIVEFGAGSGVMAADILSALKEKNRLPAHYYIIELSAYLKEIQYKTISQKIPEYIDRVVWLTALPKNPIRGVVLANEVLDAMPVTLFTMKKGIKECGVCIKDDGLALCVIEKENTQLLSQIEQMQIDFAENYTSEINLYLSGWMKSLSDMVSCGVVIIIDYGFPQHEYYHPDRSMGTLMCHYQHHSHTNPLVFPGIQDITAHVDFTAVAIEASSSGFDVAGYTNQAAFLMGCGLLTLMQNDIDEKAHFLQNQAVLKLTAPHEMGELFKVIALTKQYEKPLKGFQLLNQLHKL